MDEHPPSRPRRSLARLVALPALPLLAYAFAQTEPAATIGAGQVIALVTLLILSGFMSGSETALTAIGDWKLRQLREEGQDPRGLFALLEANPTRFITTLLIGNNLVNIAATALVTQMAIALSRQFEFGEAAAVAYATGFMTIIVLIVGEITPKSIAVHHPVAVARLVIGPVHAMSIVFYPLGLAFTYLTARVLRAFRIEPSADPLMTESELRLMLRSAEASGVIETSEKEMIKGVIDLEETVVREVMTPRVDVIALAEDATLRELLAATSEHGYSRLPVYRDTIDDVRGIVYARDILRFVGENGALDTVRVADLMHPAQYVPETTSVLDLMRDMRQRKNHLAVVVDEFGGTAGLVTLEDIIEEITGEIYDETDEDEEQDFVELPNRALRIRAGVHLEEVQERLGIELDDEGEYDTLAGFLISEFGRIPNVDDSVVASAWRFTVEEADERRVVRVRAEPIESPPGADVDATETHLPSA